MSKKSKNKTTEGQRLDYRSRAINNRIKRLQKHLKKHPNDDIAKIALSEPKIRSGRKSLSRNKTILKSYSYSINNKTFTRTQKLSKITQQLYRLANRKIENYNNIDKDLERNKKIFNYIVGNFRDSNINNKIYIELNI